MPLNHGRIQVPLILREFGDRNSSWASTRTLACIAAKNKQRNTTDDLVPEAKHRTSDEVALPSLDPYKYERSEYPYAQTQQEKATERKGKVKAKPELQENRWWHIKLGKKDPWPITKQALAYLPDLTAHLKLHYGDLFYHRSIHGIQLWLWSETTSTAGEWQPVLLGIEQDIDDRLLSLTPGLKPSWTLKEWSCRSKVTALTHTHCNGWLSHLRLPHKARSTSHMAQTESEHFTQFNPKWFANDAPTVVSYLLVWDGWVTIVVLELSARSAHFASLSQRFISISPLPLYSLSPQIRQYINNQLTLRARGLVLLCDFALSVDGAFISRELTSTDDHSDPSVVLRENVRIGDCWHITHTHGQVGIALPDFIYPINVSIDHIPAELAIEPGQAPHRMVLWGVVDGEAEIFIVLSEFKYNIYQPALVQTFPIRPIVRQLNIDFGQVVLEILDNWGCAFMARSQLEIRTEIRTVILELVD
ncbi:hypothetical protein L226DRAFT_520585 [Lentinus tigrinus ALCF2SS1-7]|uniref:uncharacterized protein n=1 Tax=Lentinus tigrinus ALCF2SS1-7 TaxID=1328758 RepID=UPI0011663277|nr:hypothetical protein L226DRAFT_520585 [Lentinus tigrinus ALCF2SS1-7]